MGQKRPHRQRPAAGIVDQMRTQQFKGVLVPSLNELPNTLRWSGGSPGHLLAEV